MPSLEEGSSSTWLHLALCGLPAYYWTDRKEKEEIWVQRSNPEWVILGDGMETHNIVGPTCNGGAFLPLSLSTHQCLLESDILCTQSHSEPGNCSCRDSEPNQQLLNLLKALKPFSGAPPEVGIPSLRKRRSLSALFSFQLYHLGATGFSLLSWMNKQPMSMQAAWPSVCGFVP